MIYTVTICNNNGYNPLISTVVMVTINEQVAINYANELMDNKNIWSDFVDVEEWKSETESECILQLTIE